MVIGGVSPTTAAVVVTKLEFGKCGAEYLFGQLGRKGFSKLWFFVAVLVPLALAVCAILLWSIVEGTYPMNLVSLIVFPTYLNYEFLDEYVGGNWMARLRFTGTT